jgi:hypothetical protein
MLACAALLLVTADPAARSDMGSHAPRQFASAPMKIAPYWLITDASPLPERPFYRPEPGSPYNMYAESGGLQVGPGLRTNAFVYDCRPDERPMCRVGRADISMPKNLGPLVGLSLHMGKLLFTEARARRGLPPPRGGLSGLLARLPIINLAILDRGGYTNLLFAY